MRLPFIRAALIVFTASFCMLVIELVAGRVLAPHVGVSLVTWTSVIGVVLAGISAGAYAGGWLADRRPAVSTVGWILLAAGVTSMAIVPATALLAGEEGLLSSMGIATTLVARVVVLSLMLFFLPAFFLGVISPLAVKLAVSDLDTAGRVVGRLYALSTLGSIAGTFTTGFWLIASFGSRSTLLGAGVVLIAAALLFGDLLGRRGRVTGALVLLAGMTYAITHTDPVLPPVRDPLLHAGVGTIYVTESQYYTILVERTVREDNGSTINALHLDHLVHSYSDPHDLAYLEYEYLRTFYEVVSEVARRHPAFRLLFIGGGGYTLPRLVERDHPLARIDVVEIDPAVTRVARQWLGLSRNGRIRTFNEDARWFAMRTEDEQHYDAIFIDAFNDLSVPYHLTTREMTARLRRLLRPDGVLAANVVDDYRRGRFLPAYVRTLESVFGEGHAAITLEAPEDTESNRSTFVVMAAQSLPALEKAYVIPPSDLRRYLAERQPIVLTDDYAPVDNMLAPLFSQRFADEVRP
ncbi:MAG: fused MFS/spermidine synthase [Acidobacteriota bacterium]